MHRRLQFGMRENPASDRRHGSRGAVRSLSEASLVQESAAPSPPSVSEPSQSLSNANGEPNAASPRAATGKKEDGTISNDTLPVSSGTRATTRRDFEPLIDSDEAARLLGNIHVKTLQRYARHGWLPGYQIGGHWYFRTSELDQWLRCQLNLSCHPCRLPKEAK